MARRPTLAQICDYLSATGWHPESSGPAGALWVHPERPWRLGVVDDPTAVLLNGMIERIALAEDRHPADVRADILDVDNLTPAWIRAGDGAR